MLTTLIPTHVCSPSSCLSTRPQTAYQHFLRAQGLTKGNAATMKSFGVQSAERAAAEEAARQDRLRYAELKGELDRARQAAGTEDSSRRVPSREEISRLLPKSASAKRRTRPHLLHADDKEERKVQAAQASSCGGSKKRRSSEKLERASGPKVKTWQHAGRKGSTAFLLSEPLKGNHGDQHVPKYGRHQGNGE